MKKIRFKGDFIVYFIVFAATLAAGLLFLLNTDIKQSVQNVVEYIIAIAILVYACSFLAPKLVRKRNAVVKGFMIAEFVVVILMSLGMILSQIKIVNVTLAQTIGLTVWARGFVEIVRGYYSMGDIHVENGRTIYDRSAKYFSIAFITIGTWAFFNMTIDKEKIVFWLAVGLLIAALVFLIFAIYCLSMHKKTTPKKEKKTKEIKENKKAKEIKEEKTETKDNKTEE